jgi:hypothetical protein
MSFVGSMLSISQQFIGFFLRVLSVIIRKYTAD